MDKNLNNPNTDEKIQFFKKEIESVKDRSLIGVIFDYLTDFILATISFWRWGYGNVAKIESDISYMFKYLKEFLNCNNKLN